MKILVLNAGSSSLKSELFETADGSVQEESIWGAEADWTQLPGPASVVIQTGGRLRSKKQIQVDSLENTVEHLLRELVNGPHPVLHSLDEIAVTGHRVVHGGGRFRESTEITEQVRNGIRELAPFAPLHNPLALAGIEAAGRVLGGKSKQIAVFDTSFHATLPPESYLYPGPYEWADRGLRRYGFHGISHQYLSRRAAEWIAPQLKKDPRNWRVITCHLGNGCSLCALRGGTSVETTMGFTPLEGLMMGSRSGTVDPGLLLYLLKHDHCGAGGLDRILNYEAGLKGLSGISGDMRQVQAAASSGNARARQALDVYVYRLSYFAAALLPSLGGLDLLVFSGGVGEHSDEVRGRTCDRLGFLGITIDREANSTQGDRLISSHSSRVAVAVLQSRENYEIARECLGANVV